MTRKLNKDKFLKNKFRRFCHFVCNHAIFSNIILVCILISSAMLAAEDPLKAESPRNRVSISKAIFRHKQCLDAWMHVNCLYAPYHSFDWCCSFGRECISFNSSILFFLLISHILFLFIFLFPLQILNYFDYFFTSVFTLEITIKVSPIPIFIFSTVA